ncbi:MAG: ATP-binding protein [Bacteroidales bacterium]|nr:ATP-binding protein [Bacteroidales bacterium]
MKRKIYDQLLLWKNKRKGKSAMMIEGARRVGKSFIVEEFARNEYKSYILIDFFKVGDDIKDLFKNYKDNLDMLFTYISTFYSTKLYERESIIVFDEIEFCPAARAAIKYLVEDGRYDYLETGSLLGMQMSTKRKLKKNETKEDYLVPSEEEKLVMHPMDFEEFLWANGQDNLMDFIRAQFKAKAPVGQSMHRKIMDFFRLYMIIGGMPQAVLEYLDTKSFEDVDRVKRQILNLYNNCINQYAGIHAAKVKAIYEAIPSQLQLHEHKFQLSDLNKDARFRDYDSSFFWLRDARMVNLAFNTTEPSIGLGLKQKDNSLKCYMNDTGLMISHAFDERGIVSEQLYQKILKDKLEVNAGMLMENIVAQMLTANGCKLFFYSNPTKENKDDRMEIDFLIAKSSITSRHNISPIEVKSSNGFSTVSLEKCIKKYNTHLAQAYIVHTGDVTEDGDYLYIPLYMVPCL